jgi:hypothetical protein
VDRLQEKLEQLNPDDPISDDIKQELKKLADRMRKETEAIRKLADNPLPYDLDKQLSAELDKAAKLTQAAAESVEMMLGEPGLNNDTAKEALSEISKQLGAGKQSFDQATMPPLELLAAVLPLKAAENRFIQIVMQQKDLADRLSSLKEHDPADDPAIRTRMRELEEEQRQIQESLNKLLDDIIEHAKMLPEKAELEKLRETALDFAYAVQQSGAHGAMGDAMSALAEYSGSHAYAKAVLAAEILEQFLSKCEGMGECASECALGFSPSLGGSMSQTLSQLLRNMGMGGSGGTGMFGGGSGYGAQRGGGNVGLYGMLPGMSAFAEGQGGRQTGAQAFGQGGVGGGLNPDFDSGYGVSPEGEVGGASEGIIPLRYRQAVGRYFQRVVEAGE